MCERPGNPPPPGLGHWRWGGPQKGEWGAGAGPGGGLRPRTAHAGARDLPYPHTPRAPAPRFSRVGSGRPRYRTALGWPLRGGSGAGDRAPSPRSDIFAAASVGLTEWFYSSTVVRFKPLYFTNDPNLQAILTDVVERRIGVNGKVVESLKTIYDLSPVESLLSQYDGYGAFSCTFRAEWNYWMQYKKLECDQAVDRGLDDDLQELADRQCSGRCAYYTRGWQDAYPRCADLQAFADTGDDFYIWLERAVCSGGKGVVAMLSLSMVAATAGMVMCYFCAHKPQLIMIPGILILVLTAIAVIAYGAAVSSAYPFTYVQREDDQIENIPVVDGAQSDTANVQVGFGLAIAAAILSFVSTTLAWAGRYLPSDGFELQVVSAMPVQIFGGAGDGAADPEGGGGGGGPPPPGGGGGGGGGGRCSRPCPCSMRLRRPPRPTRQLRRRLW
uniref:Uncharacterized protein n=1 Tax=Hemiselmis tepida TaxID=464990 RepID=A0A7S0VXW3_9CRYP